MTKSTTTGPRFRWIVAAAAIFAALRLAYVLHTLECFASLDDGWIVQYARELAGRSLSGNLAALVDVDVFDFSGGTRLNIVPLGLASRWIDPTYGLVKASAVMWSVGVLVATLWALDGRLRTPALWLLAVFAFFPPFPALLLSGRLTGNHQEIPFFIMCALGIGLRLSRARTGSDGAAVKRWGLLFGFVMGIGVYYCQTFWLWVAVQGSWFLWDRRAAPKSGRSGELAWIGLGLLPGVALCCLAYVPDHWPSIFLPYIDTGLPRQEMGEIHFDLGEMRMRLGRIWPGPLGRPWPELSVLGSFGTSFLWIPAAWVATRRSSRTLRVTVGLLALFVVFLLASAAAVGIAEERHLMPIVPIFLLFQVLVLTKVMKGGGARRLAVGTIAAGAILAPRVADVAAALPGTYTLSEGWNFPGKWLADLDVASLTEAQVTALRPIVDPVYRARLAPVEREVLLLGIGEPFARSAGVYPGYAQPFAHRRWSDGAWVHGGTIVDGRVVYSPRFEYLAGGLRMDQVRLEVLYFTGFALGFEVFAGIEGGPALPLECIPCGGATTLVAGTVWSRQVFQELRSEWSEATPWPPLGRSTQANW